VFQVPQYQLIHPGGEFGIYECWELQAASFSVAFVKLLVWDAGARFLRFRRRTVWFPAVAGVLTIGLMGCVCRKNGILGRRDYKHVGES